VKSVVVKALILLVVDVRLFRQLVARAERLMGLQAAKYPWQPSMDCVFPVLTHRIRSLFVVRTHVPCVT